MWKNNGCKKPGNDEILQDRKKHEKKTPNYGTHPMTSTCNPHPHFVSLLLMNFFQGHDGPTTPGALLWCKKTNCRIYSEKKGKHKQQNEHSRTYLSELIGDCSPFHLQSLVVSVNMAAPINDF